MLNACSDVDDFLKLLNCSATCCLISSCILASCLVLAPAIEASPPLTCESALLPHPSFVGGFCR
jgi:hypothetical protein